MTDPVTLTLVRYPPRNLAGRRSRRHVRVPLRGIGAAAVGLLWLPAGFHLGLALAGGIGLAIDADGWLRMAALAAGGVPLALACRLLWRQDRAWAACAAFAVLGPGGGGGNAGARGIRAVRGGDGCGGGEPARVADVRAPEPGARAGRVKPGRVRGYTKSAALCRAFLDEHAPRRSAGQGEATNSDGGTAGVASQGGRPRKAGSAPPGMERPKATGSCRLSGSERARRETSGDAGEAGAGSPTPLRIPYGNKEVAFSMGARYGADGWYAPPGVDLDAFRQRGWL